MACEAVRTWSLSGLLAAFLDLVIAYALLCASAVAYLGSKFLGVFGLPLPCPCDVGGVFSSIRSRSFCLNRLLVEFPGQMVSHVFISVKEHFPFHDSSMARSCNYSTTVGEISMSEFVEMEGQEASCSSLSDARKADLIRIRELTARADKYDLKGKGVAAHRPRSRLRQRRKLLAGGLGKSSVATGGKLCSAHSRDDMAANGLDGGTSLMDDHNDNQYDDKASTTMGVTVRAVAAVDDYIFMNPRAQVIEELHKNGQEVQPLHENEKNVIRLLEQKLEEERIARASLYIELEKERSSAATAADEAMAMILRLQEEKASVEMDARQYQRILEEKSIYDDEEKTILKEILIRREKEKHFLEKEVEAYRRMVSTGDQQIRRAGFEPNDDQGAADEQLFQMSDSSSYGNMNLQEKQIISVDNNLPLSLKATQDCEKAACFGGIELEQIQGHKLAEKVIVSCHGTEVGNQACGPKGTVLGFSSYSCDSNSDKDSQVHDVHIDGINVCSKVNVADESELLLSVNDSPEVRTTDFPSSGEFDGKKSNLEMITHGFQPISPMGFSSLPQSCATPVDREMVKIKSEVGWLQERLKLVQESREKLSLSGENQERENVHLKALEEDIARQVQGICHLTETGKAVRQVSLPPPTIKVASKKRRSRSVSSGFRTSSEV